MRKYALIGSGIGYSLSPRIHKIIYGAIGLEDCSYDIEDIAPDCFDSYFPVIKEKYAGFNVTVPFKHRIEKYLYLSHSPVAAINTVVSGCGSLVGYNTDIDGFRMHFGETFGVAGGKTLIIGSGGAAECAAHVLSGTNELYIKSRNAEKTAVLKRKYGISDLNGVQPAFVVNATGKNIEEENLLHDVDTNKLQGIYDMSYTYAELKSKFGKKGILYEGGLRMLIYQAVFAAEILYDTAIVEKKELCELIKREIIL